MADLGLSLRVIILILLRLIRSLGGYDADSIFKKVTDAALTVNKGEACFERDGYLFYEEEFDLELLSAFYMVALYEKDLKVLDFGGSFASTYIQNKRKIDNMKCNVAWNIIEQEHFVDFGRKNLESNNIRYYKSLNEVNGYNIVLFSGALQYIENYLDILNNIFASGVKYIITDRIPISDENRICVEYVHEPIYEAAYPVYVYREDDFIDMFERAGYRLESEWIKNRNYAYIANDKLIYEKSFFWMKD